MAFGLSKASSNATNGDPTDVSVLEEDIGSPNFDNALSALNIEGIGGMDMYSSMINAGVTDHPGQNDPDKFGWRGGSHRYLVVLTDTMAQEFPFQPHSLPGNPSQADVANQLAAGDVTLFLPRLVFTAASICWPPYQEEPLTTLTIWPMPLRLRQPSKTT